MRSRWCQVDRENLGELVNRDLHDHQHRDEVIQRLEVKKRLVEAEIKHTTDARFAVTHEQALVQIAALVDILRRRIEDPDLLRPITEDIDRIVRGTKGGFQRDADRN